jgi:hypothetical protein
MTKSDQELARLEPAVKAELADFMNYCIHALDDLTMLNKPGALRTDPETTTKLRHALTAMQDAYLSVSMMGEITDDLYTSLKTHLKAKRSTEAAYQAGWEARYAAIMARLTPEESDLLRQALDGE